VNEIEVCLIAAVARNGAIGADNRLLWRLPSDLKRFRALTLDKPLIMGRKTFISIGRPLPGRRNIVVTRDPAFAHTDVVVAHDIASALRIAKKIASESGQDSVSIGGGAEIYRQTIDLADRLFVTEVDSAPAGDAKFPEIDPLVWREVRRETPARTKRDEVDFAFVDYERRQAAA
jgi:dihydrofolate reductase